MSGTFNGRSIFNSGNVSNNSSDAGELEVVVNKTNGSGSPYQMLAGDSGKIFTNNGAGAETYLNLPTSPKIGYVAEGVCLNANNMRFVAQGSQKITLGSTVGAAAGYAQMNGNGSALKLVYVSTNKWYATTSEGTINIA